MQLKWFLILMTVIAVISDSLLHPFYPQYFAEVFGVQDPQQVGLYIAACSLTVMLSFPFWAYLAKKIQVLHLLVVTQIATGLLSVICFTLTDLLWFWLLSLLSMVFKASYLLIYPYVMSLEEKHEHINTIGLLAFVVYFGHILAAMLSGVIFQTLEPRYLFIVMAAGDLIQIMICLLLIKNGGFALQGNSNESPAESRPSGVQRGFVAKLGMIMLLFYFSAYLTEPFFSLYWEQVSNTDNKLVSGLVFSISGLAALAGLTYNSRLKKRDSTYSGVIPAIALGIVGLFLQGSGQQFLVLIGRFFYGWGLFHSMVRLDLLLFKISSKESYATDFSRINMFQALGIQFASFTAGALVDNSGLKIPFIVAALGFSVGAILYRALFREKLQAEATPNLASQLT